MHRLDTPFAGRRSISSSRELPALWPHGPASSHGVRLVGTGGADGPALRAAGALRDGRGWVVSRADPFPFDALDHMLPRFARRTIVPEVVDLIPSSSWFASLANMLTASSWADVRSAATRAAGGCGECGSAIRPEAHEAWSYDGRSGTQTLTSIRSLCRLCHETMHLGRASVAGRFDRAFDRLCSVNRIRVGERRAYREAVFGKWEERSRVEWAIDPSLCLSLTPVLHLRPGILYAGDGWVVQPGNARRRDVGTRIAGAEVLADGAGLVVTAIGTLASQCARAALP